jgi:hypothetical protein
VEDGRKKSLEAVARRGIIAFEDEELIKGRRSSAAGIFFSLRPTM